MSGIPKPTLSYDESQWKIEIFPMSTSDFLVFTYIGESFRGDGKTYPHKLKPFATSERYKRVNLVIQVDDYEFMVVCCVDIHIGFYNPIRTVGYDVYHIMVYPDIPNENGVTVVTLFRDINDVRFLRTTKSFMFFITEESRDREPLIYSVIDAMTLDGWILAREMDWRVHGAIRIDKYYDDLILPTLVVGRITSDFELEFEIDLRKGSFADGFRAITSCKSALYKNPVKGLASFYDVDNFIKSSLSNLKTVDFYMRHGGFYIGNEKLPVLEQQYNMKKVIWEEVAKQKLMEANNLQGVEPVKAVGPPQVLSGFRVLPEINIRPVDNALIIEHDGKISIIESSCGRSFCSFCQIGEKSFIGMVEESVSSSEVVYDVCRYEENKAGKIVYSTGYGIFPHNIRGSTSFFASNNDDIIYLDDFRYCISEDKPIEDPRIDKIPRLEYLFATTNDGRKILVEARRYERIYFLTTVQKEDSGYAIKILDKVYNAYTGTIFSGIKSFDEIIELGCQNRKWADWAKTEISRIIP